MTFDRRFAPEPARIAVLGLGYVGCVTAACFAELGHFVTGVERDAHKVQSLSEGRAPFFEPQLDALVAAHCADGRLRATTSLAEGLDGADLAFVCVGTPPDAEGNPALDQLHRVCSEVAACTAPNSRPLTLVIRSTVFPDSLGEIAGYFRHAAPHVTVAGNPEFLREGSAVTDFLEPSLVVVGGDDLAAVDSVAELYRPLGTAVCRTSLRTAAMVKFACNAFHAMKVSFANEIGAVCANLDISGQEVMETVCQDRKLNISPAYLQPGFAFGGSCLAKDLRALTNSAARSGLHLPLLESVLPSNGEQVNRAAAAVAQLPAGRIGIYGLAFKENTDDLRESPVVALLELLLRQGREVRVFDPHVRLANIYGSNRAYLVAAIPEIDNMLAASLPELLEWAGHVVVAQKPDAEAAHRMAASSVPLLQLTCGGGTAARAAAVAVCPGSPKNGAGQ